MLKQNHLVDSRFSTTNKMDGTPQYVTVKDNQLPSYDIFYRVYVDDFLRAVHGGIEPPPQHRQCRILKPLDQWTIVDCLSNLSHLLLSLTL